MSITFCDQKCLLSQFLKIVRERDACQCVTITEGLITDFFKGRGQRNILQAGASEECLCADLCQAGENTHRLQSCAVEKSLLGNFRDRISQRHLFQGRYLCEST